MSKRIYVGNLPFSVGQKELRDLFEKYGKIEDAEVISDKFNGRSKGFGFVTFENDADVGKAIAATNEKDFNGRALKVNEARPREERTDTRRR